LGNLPLALEQAAAYIRKIRLKVSHYVNLLGEYSIDTFKGENAKALFYKQTVKSTFEISFTKLSESAKIIMNLCAYMAPDRIPVAFFVEMREKLPSPICNEFKDELSVLDAFSNIKDYSLANGNAYFINIHRLVQEVTRKKHDESNVKD
jgi:hypothetical protein